MEKGTIKLYDKNSGAGLIGRASDPDVRFCADNIIAKDRTRLAPGDAVWFEVDNINSTHMAINIRKV